MAIDTEKARQKYTERYNNYKTQIDVILQREKNLLQLMEKDSSGIEYKRLALAEDMLNLSSLYLLVHNLSVSILGTKSDDSLNEARKTLYKSIIYLEEIVTNYVDVPFTDYEKNLEAIASVPEAKRYQLIKKLGLAIRLVIDAYGENTKWKWTFVELEGRFAIVAKNIMDLRAIAKDGLDPHSPDYEISVYHLRLVKHLLQQGADRYREKYELSTKRIDDFRMAIQFLLALRRIHLVLNEREEAEETKKKAEIWKEKMEKDNKSLEAQQKKR